MVVQDTGLIQAESGANQYLDHLHSVGVSAGLAFVGGYLDGFTFVGHGRIFANAMTGNIVYLGMEVLSSPARPNFRHLPPLFMFMLGIWGARALHLPRFRRIVRHPYSAVLLAEASSYSYWPFFRMELPTSGLPRRSPSLPRCRYSRFVRLESTPIPQPLRPAI
jgi:hypothetical protein